MDDITDFYAWTREQANALRRGASNEIDWDNLAEKIETVGRSERREVRSRLALILRHLLKWQYQPERQSRDGRNTISTQREDLSDVIADSPSLKAYQSEILADAYARGSPQCAQRFQMPEDCPWTIDQVGNNFLP